MPGHLPLIDTESLQRLRRLVRAIHQKNGGGLPLGHLVELAGEVPADKGITIDVAASRELGHPMVVVRVPKPHAPSADFGRLSTREREVAGLVAEGLSNREIAARLYISVATTKDHVHNILAKLGLPNRTAVAAAHRPAPEPTKPTGT